MRRIFRFKLKSQGLSTPWRSDLLETFAKILISVVALASGDIHGLFVPHNQSDPNLYARHGRHVVTALGRQLGSLNGPPVIALPQEIQLEQVLPFSRTIGPLLAPLALRRLAPIKQLSPVAPPLKTQQCTFN
jgi:hypothetical protein